MKEIIFILAMLFCPNLFAATLTTNTVPYVCQGGTNPQLCNSNITTDSSGNLVSGLMFAPNNIQVFTSGGTWIKPAGVSKVYVKAWAGGGGGGNYYAVFEPRSEGCVGNGNGGASGGYFEGFTSVTGNVVVTVGSGGSLSGGSGGSPGGNSEFAGVTPVIAGGGQGGADYGGSNNPGGVSSGNGISVAYEASIYGLAGIGGSCGNPGSTSTGVTSPSSGTSGFVIVYY